MPPIPDDAVVIADYMLMADFVPQTANGLNKISKGARLVAASRDHLHNSTNGALTLPAPSGYIPYAKTGIRVTYENFTSEQGPQLTYFGDAKVVNDVISESDAVTSYIQYFDGATTNVTVDSAYTDNGAVVTGAPSTGSQSPLYIYGTKSTGVMGIQTVKFVGDELGGSAADWLYHSATQVSTPIHTSSHYQTFETPFLHELVGGDRNMEQTNLVVTPDGKTWDEVTRDTSYMGPSAGISVSRDAGNMAADSTYIFDYFRGESVGRNMYLKGFTPAYDRIICLEEGEFKITLSGFTSDGTYDLAYYLKLNGTTTYNGSCSGDSTRANLWNVDCIRQLKRGDYLQFHFIVGAVYGGAISATHFEINKIG
jgi:hypothetical protein